jgi:hypothetical protein
MNYIFKSQIEVTSMREGRYLKRRVQKRLNMWDYSCFLYDFQREAQGKIKLSAVNTVGNTKVELLNTFTVLFAE